MVPFGTGRFLASLRRIMRVPFFLLLFLSLASPGTYFRATITSPLEFVTDSSSGGSVWGAKFGFNRNYRVLQNRRGTAMFKISV